MKCLWKIAAALAVIAGATIVIVKYWDKIMEKLHNCRCHCGCVTIHEMPEEAPEEAPETPDASEAPAAQEEDVASDAPSAEDFAD